MMDTLFYETMVEEKFEKVFNIVKLILLLSHGNSSVERGFSINKEIEVENMKEHTLVAKRVICDHVYSVDGILNVQLDKPLLLSVKQSRQKYERYLESERLKKKTAESQAKRKCVLDEIEEIKKKKKRTETDIRSLTETAGELLLKAVKEGKLTFLTQANSLRKTAKSKAVDLEEIQKSLDSKVKELKE